MDVVDVMGLPVSVTNKVTAANCIIERALLGKGDYYCFVNTHMCVEAQTDEAFMAVLHGATRLFADSRPIFWFQRWHGLVSEPYVEQIRGVDLMRHLCKRAADENIPIGLWGGKNDMVLHKLKSQLLAEYPRLDIVYAVAPSFQPLSDAERNAVAIDITTSGAKLLFVGLGCPKQERWMAQFSILPIQMFGVGAAFDFLSLQRREAPVVLQKMGLEWAFRLSQEPSRLLWRYLKNNTQFMWLLVKHLGRSRR